MKKKMGITILLAFILTCSAIAGCTSAPPATESAEPAVSSGTTVSAASTVSSAVSESASGELDLNSLTIDELIVKAKEDGQIQSTGLPDEWANFGETWRELGEVYGLSHADVDMSSAEEIALYEAEKNAPSKDIGDVGIAFGPIGVEKGLFKSYKTSYWDEIPDWAKDPDGYWACPYYGAIVFCANMDYVDKMPTSWAELLEGDYLVTPGDVARAARPQLGVLSAAVANGGDEGDILPGLDIYRQLAEQGRLDIGEDTRARIEKGEIQFYITTDFIALEHKTNMTNLNLQIQVPTDGAAVAAYASVINNYAPHPYAAALAKEYIFSNEGQDNLAKGFARPIRYEYIKDQLSDEAKACLLPGEMYQSLYVIQDQKAWETTCSNMGELWQENVLAYIQ